MIVEVVCDSVPEADVYCRLMRRGEFARPTAIKGYLEEIGAESSKEGSQGKHEKIFAICFAGDLKFLPDRMQLGPES